jgi:hypothetical protein
MQLVAAAVGCRKKDGGGEIFFSVCVCVCVCVCGFEDLRI